MFKKRFFLGAFCVLALISLMHAEELDLIGRAASAVWRNGDLQNIQFGRDGREAGTAKYIMNAALEDGKMVKKVLFTHPQWKNGGSIHGFFSNINVPAKGGKLIVSGGFLKGANGTDGVTFTAHFIGGTAARVMGRSRIQSRDRLLLGSFHARMDGKIDRQQFDLRQAAGQRGTIILGVEAGRSPDSDWAVWTEAKIVWGQALNRSELIKRETKALLLKTLTGHTNRIYRASFSPDGKYAVTASGDHSAKVWNVKSGQMLLNLTDHSTQVFCADFSANSRMLVTTGGDVAKVWHIPGGGLITTLSGHTMRVGSARFNASGTRVVTTSEDGSIKVWEIPSGRLFRTIPITSEGWTYTAVFDPRGGSIAVGGQSGLLGIWDVNNGHRIMALRGHRKALHQVRFNRTGTLLVSASADETARLWDVSSGRLIRTFTGHYFDEADISPNEKYIITADNDGKAIIWNLKNGRKILELQHAPGGRVMTARFSANGRYVITGGENRVAKIWEVILPQ